ncbi:hypothetical protein [Streptomyces sp. YKOK-I1]
MPRATVEENIGTLAPHRAITAQRACLTAFFDRRLGRRGDEGAFDRLPERYPELRIFS